MAAGHDLETYLKRRRARNWALLALLAGLVVLFYVITIVRMGGGGP